MDTLNQLFARYERDVLPRLGERTQVDYRRHLETMRHRWGHLHPDELKPKDIGQYLGEPGGPVNRNRCIAVLSAVYTKAVGRWFVAERNPCANVERNPTKPRDRYITHEEFLLTSSAAPESVQVAMLLAYLTGQRQADIVGLRWEHVSKDGIYFKQGKTGKRLMISMSVDLECVLARAKRLHAEKCSEYVICTREGKRYTNAGFRALWQRTMAAAMKAGLKQRHTFHDIRAKTVSDSGTIEEASARAGHLNTNITRTVYDRNVRVVKPLS